MGWPENEVAIVAAACIAELPDDEIREVVTQLMAARKLMNPRVNGELAEVSFQFYKSSDSRKGKRHA